MIDRHITSQVLAALADTPVVVLTGAEVRDVTNTERLTALSCPRWNAEGWLSILKFHCRDGIGMEASRVFF